MLLVVQVVGAIAFGSLALVVTIVDGWETEDKKQLKNLHLRTHEATAMRSLLTTYAEAVAEERSKMQQVQQVCMTARRRANSIIMTHRAKGGRTQRGVVNI